LTVAKTGLKLYVVSTTGVFAKTTSPVSLSAIDMKK